MKKAKKLLALLLALMMVFSLLAACGNDGYVEDDDDDDDDDDEKSSASGNKNNDETKGDNNDETKGEGNQDETRKPQLDTDDNNNKATQDPTYNEPSVTEGVDVPSVDVPSEMSSTARGAITIDELNTMCLQVLDSYGDTIYIGIQNGYETALLYYRDADNYEYVLTIDGNDNMYGYFKYAEDAAFSPDTDTSSVEDYYDYLVSCFSDLTTHGEHDGFGYLSDGTVTAQTGMAYADKVYYDGDYMGYVWIDQATGICVYEVTAENDVVYQVLDIDTSASWIPNFQ